MSTYIQYILECSILISTGTTFEEDRVAQGHLKSLGSAFQEISKTEEGQVMLVAMEGLATRIKVRFRIQWNSYSRMSIFCLQSETSFKDAVKVCFRLAKRITSNPWVQFGMFIGLFGLLIALLGQFGTMTALGLGFTQFMRSVGMMIVSSALMPVCHGVKQSVDNFMKKGEDFMEKKR